MGEQKRLANERTLDWEAEAQHRRCGQDTRVADESQREEAAGSRDQAEINRQVARTNRDIAKDDR